MTSQVTGWSIAGRFNTIEHAERLLNLLRARGIEAYVTLIGGLSVIARFGVADPVEPSKQPTRERVKSTTRIASTA